MTCTATCVRTGQTCTRKAKYEFAGDGRYEPMCGVHAHDLLGRRPLPDWVTSLKLHGRPVPV